MVHKTLAIPAKSRAFGVAKKRKILEHLLKTQLRPDRQKASSADRKKTIMAPITIYSKPACPQCDLTKNFLNRENVQFVELDISEDDEALAFVKNLGYMQAPVVISEPARMSWSGFRPDKLNEVVSALKEMTPQAN